MRKILGILTFLWILVLLVCWSGVGRAQNNGYAPSSNGISVPLSLWASLPPAAQNNGVMFYVPDTSGGASLSVSDGTTWRYFGRGYSSQSYTLTTGDAGIHTFALTGFTAVPDVQVSIVDNTTNGGLTYNLQGVTTVSATVRVNRNLLTALFGGATAGVTINLFAVPTN